MLVLLGQIVYNNLEGKLNTGGEVACGPDNHMYSDKEEHNLS